MIKQFQDIIQEYKSLNLSEVIDYDKFNRFSIVHHSTVIEGSTLTEIETRLLLDDGITPKGKPMIHSQMVSDHYKALVFVLDESKQGSEITPGLIQKINSLVMRTTGSVYNTAHGQVDATRGEFRKGNVSAGASYFVNYDKVPGMVDELCKTIKEKQSEVKTEQDKLNLSFDAHFNLVSIHPFYDGNGRTSRLLMNYLQALYNIPPGIVFKEDKAAYFEALKETRLKKDIEIFRDFMEDQYWKYLKQEIDLYKKTFDNRDNRGAGFHFLF
jgi:Fic family protein